ncbi:MAG: Zn-dependent exopeptidase M28 [Deltaproteobacteria bacterium]|nr:Zn-dependent exopeptidase M28 [Deltaproteobacteria bacterium]
MIKMVILSVLSLSASADFSIRPNHYRLVLGKLTGVFPLGGEDKTFCLRDRYLPDNQAKALCYIENYLSSAGFTNFQREAFSVRGHEPVKIPIKVNGEKRFGDDEDDDDAVLSYDPGHSFNYTPRSDQGINLYTEISGEVPNEVVILGAHYDTTGVGMPGCDDNGTGVASVMTAARAIKVSGLKPRRTLRFVFFDGEECGMHGSRTHFVNSKQRGESIALFNNIDMLGFAPKGVPSVSFDPGLHFKGLEKFVMDLALPSSMIFTNWRNHISDNRVGVGLEIPSVSYFEDARKQDGFKDRYPHYHTAADTIDKLNMEYATEATQVIASIVVAAAQTEARWEKVPPPPVDLNWRPRSEKEEEAGTNPAEESASSGTVKPEKESCGLRLFKRWFH